MSYDQQFYDNINDESRRGASIILPRVFDLFGFVPTVFDFGCGEGVWLRTALDLGSERVFGIDGDHVDLERLQIPKASFLAADLSESNDRLVPEDRFRLALSLEVAEHLPAWIADSVVETLCAAADVVLFSAAAPLQGGEGHINERWPEYWWNLFACRGYRGSDKIRWDIWNDKRIPYYYRQNLMIFARNGADHPPDLRDYFESPHWHAYSFPPKPVVHPEWALMHSGFPYE